MSNELKALPCPWCGGTPNIDDNANFHLTDGVKYGALSCCGTGPEVRTDYKDVSHWKVAAIEAWNDRRATSGAASGEVVTVPREATEAMLHAAEDVPAPRTYGAVWRAMVGAAEQSAPPVPGMGGITNDYTDPELACSDCGLTMGESRLLGHIKLGIVATQSASTAPGQADWCPECHARESDGYEQALERDAARWVYWRTIYGNKWRIIPGSTFMAETPEELDAAIDSAIAALSKEKP